MKLGAWSFMGAFFSIQIGFGVKNFGSQTPWSKNWCLVQELVFNLYQAYFFRISFFVHGLGFE
jgi:hypothetical protein